MNKIAQYKIEAYNYWNYQYQTVGWQTVNDSGGLDKTEKLAEREIDLYLWPTKEKTEILRNDKENNPYPTMTPDMDLHPKYDGKYDLCLDYGCGGLARYSAALSNHFKSVIGVDISLDAINMGKKRLTERNVKNARLLLCNGISLAFPDNHFDFIFSNLVLQHIGNKDVNFKLATEFARTLRPGGMARLEYLHKSQKKHDNFESPVEGNGISAEELAPYFEIAGAKIACYTEENPWLWITVVK